MRDKRPKSIFTFCMKGFPGTNRSLLNLERTAGLTRHFVLSGSNRNAEIEFFTDYIMGRRPCAVIFGGWSPAYSEFMARLGTRGVEYGIYWTSSPGQTDISGEAPNLEFLMKDRRIRHRLFANKDLASSLSGHIKGVSHLPDTVVFPEETHIKRAGRKNGAFTLSFFCSPFEYKRKNILNTVLAVSMLKGDYVLYLNGLSRNDSYKGILKKLSVRYKDFGWMASEEYRRVLGEVTLGLQVSFAETFNFVAADHISMRIPVITSRMVPAMDSMTKKVKSRLVVDDPDSPEEIAGRIEYFISDPRKAAEIGDAAYRCLLKDNIVRIESARKVLAGIKE